MKTKETCVSKNLDNNVCLQSEKSEKEKDYKVLQRARVALSVWPAHQPRRSPKEREDRFAREIEVKEKTENRNETCWRCRDQRKACKKGRLQRKNCEILGLPKKEWPQCHKVSSWQVRLC